MNQIHTAYMKTNIGELVIGTFDHQLCLLDFRYRRMRQTVDNRIKKWLNAEFVEQTNDLILQTQQQIEAYLQGERKTFDIPLLFLGTDFQQQVWQELCRIPYGETASYLDIAKRIDNPKAVRAVASANGANAIALIVPCHRVIETNGGLGGYGGGVAVKKRLLKLENAPISTGASMLQQQTMAFEKTVPEQSPRRCSWVKLDNPLSVHYHDEEWGVPVFDDRRLFEMLVLEGAQAGLSWETILNKRVHYRQAFDNFEPHIVAGYDEEKIQSLLQNKGIVRNQLKIRSAINNAKIFQDIQREYGSFSDYLWAFVEHKPIRNHYVDYADAPTTTELSDRIAKDLQQRGMSFVGSTIIYAFMQAVGLVNDHQADCFLGK